MQLKTFLRFSFFCLAISVVFLNRVAAQNQEIDIPKLISEGKIKSDENWRNVIKSSANYTFKWRKIRRFADNQGKIKEESQLGEVFYPSKCPVKKCKAVYIELEKDGKAVSAEKIEKQRIKAGEKLEKQENDENAQKLPLKENYPLYWMRFSFYIRRPFESEPKTIIKIDAQELLEKCEFYQPEREQINGREAISLRFRPRSGAIFDEESRYASNVEGKIWIDAEDKVFFRLAMWQKETKFENQTSDYLLANAALAYNMTRTKKGVWFHHLGRISGIKNTFLAPQMKDDFSIEDFDYHYFETEIKNVEVKSPA